MKMKIAIIREGKNPPDSRVPLSPEQCVHVEQMFPIQLKIQPSPSRCFKDEDYIKAGLNVTEDLEDCDIFMGVKEVPIPLLVSDKSYFFFSHTIKKQAYNKPLLQAILSKNIRMIDYEVLTNEKGQRLIAFGVFAGMVGAHNGIMTYGLRTGKYQLPRMKDCHDYEAAVGIYKTVSLPPMKIVLTGTGRVASGSARVLKDMGIRQVDPQDYLVKTYQEPVFTQLSCSDYVERKDGEVYKDQDFFQYPTDFQSKFLPYTTVSDIMINGIYWDNKAPSFFTVEDMKADDFNIKVIADVTCDIAPVSSIPSTIKASTIADPLFGFDPKTGKETTPHQNGIIDMMTIDNLPNELPRDASKAFGQQFIDHIIPQLLEGFDSPVIKGASMTEGGKLTDKFGYLKEWVMS